MRIFHYLKKFTELGSFIGLICFVLVYSDGSLCYDEPYYYQNVALLNKLGLGVDFFSNMYGPAGPVHAILFWVLQDLTGDSVMGVRLVNVFLLFFVILCMKLIYTQIYPNIENNDRGWSMGLLSIPMTFVCSGLALTEMSALLLLVLSLYFLIRYRNKHSFSNLVFSSILLSLSVLGRQQYLLLVPFFATYVYFDKLNSQRLINSFQYLILSLLLPCSIFFVWNGIVPNVGGDIANTGNFVWRHVFLGLGYSGFITLLLDRRYFVPITRRYIYGVLGLIVFVTIVVIAFEFKFLVMTSVTLKFFPPRVVYFMGYLNAIVLVVFGLWFMMSLVRDALINSGSFLHIIFIISIFLIVLSCGKVAHQFSSRYIYQAVIFFILIIPPRNRDKVQYLLSICGSALGFISLYSYTAY